jgi:hypothetical protein
MHLVASDPECTAWIDRYSETKQHSRKYQMYCCYIFTSRHCSTRLSFLFASEVDAGTAEEPVPTFVG